MCVLNIYICKCLVSSQANIMSNFHAVEVVGRGSETQVQVGGNLNYMYTQHFKGSDDETYSDYKFLPH